MIRVIVMGVSGSGKSSVGADIAKVLGLPFLEGDSLHPASNVAKMAAGTPLTDDDRWPWLDQIGATLAAAEDGIVVSCSALKKVYRDRLRKAAAGPLAFVFLDGSEAVLPVTMLGSQLTTLEAPVDEPRVLRQDVAEPINVIVQASVSWLKELDP
ncbi:gluconokinase [Phyllobacterium sp. BT25]|uniref:Gluconokinase n=1 Tax=Phyllobacterium pellucidum TaxID=2740464 RepID=A0A849VYZ1_9HYPH|nr:gluconokinase [Phyllobacterium pellucidum]NTS34054.1 gluconokinase [Phyllobacterium pellucidum]